MKINCSHTRLVDIETLVPNPKNPNQHPERQIELLAKILSFQGWRSPVVVSNLSGFVVKGHGRLLAARKNGWTSIPVDFQDYESLAQEYADLVADNKIAELAEHDDKLMLEGLQDFPDLDFELLGLGNFNMPEITSLIDDFKPTEEHEKLCPACGFKL